VKVDLLVRGICCLRAGVPGVSDNIKVTSIVGRFLEHSRVYYFANGGEEEIYIGSADWMPRNLYERVEVLVPLRDEMLRNRVRHEILDAYLADNRKARVLLKDATYIRAWQPVSGKRNRRQPTGAAVFSAQDFMMTVAEGKSPAMFPAPEEPRKRRVSAGRVR
jgi:polyphosphate kinase